MNRTCVLFATGLVCFPMTGPVQAQIQVQVQTGESFFQPAVSLSAGRGGRGGVALPMVPAEAGKPFSAMAISRSEQTYSDGTHVTHTVTMMEYRDMEGRTRMEPAEPPEPVKQIMIRDPVAGVRYSLNIAGKTATKIAMSGALGPIVQTPPGNAAAPTGRGRGGRGGGAASDLAELQDNLQKLAQVSAAVQELARTAAKNPNATVEDLGTMSLNGVTAHGTRTTVVVPAGAIGNDREFRSIEERWFSDDLNLLVKSVSTDPRFGTTTYERRNISRQTPDSSLFQIPAGYSIVSN
jgi:hypothetical protein